MTTSSGLTINEVTGEISSTKTMFDYEQQPQVVIQVTASDQDNKHKTFASVVLDVNDIDDVPPAIVVQVRKRN